MYDFSSGAQFTYQRKQAWFPPIGSGSSTTWALYSSGFVSSDEKPTVWTERFVSDTYHLGSGTVYADNRNEEIYGGSVAVGRGWSTSTVAGLEGLTVIRRETLTDPWNIGSTVVIPGPVFRQDATTHDLRLITPRGAAHWPLSPHFGGYPADPADVQGFPLIPGTFSNGRVIGGDVWLDKQQATSPASYASASLTVVIADPVDTLVGSFSDAWQCTFSLPNLVYYDPRVSGGSYLASTVGTLWFSPSVGSFVRLQWRQDFGAEANRLFTDTTEKMRGYQFDLTAYHHGPA